MSACALAAKARIARLQGMKNATHHPVSAIRFKVAEIPT